MVRNKTSGLKQAKSVSPSIFGFRVRASRALKFLRTGESADVLDIRATTDTGRPPPGRPVLAWKLEGSNRDVRAELYGAGATFKYWISDAGWYDIDPVQKFIGVPDDADAIVCEQRLWGMPALLCAMQRNDFFLHAAAVEIDNAAVLFAAPGRHGKTTLAMAFHREGFRVLSEDSACCRVVPFPVLLPGPALLRVRPDVYEGHPPDGTHVVSVYDDRIYLGIDANRQGTDDPVSIKAIVFLRESVENIHMERVPAPKALPDLWALTFRLPNDEARARSFLELAALVGHVPVWNLYRPLRLESLSNTVSEIFKVLSQKS